MALVEMIISSTAHPSGAAAHVFTSAEEEQLLAVLDGQGLVGCVADAGLSRSH